MASKFRISVTEILTTFAESRGIRVRDDNPFCFGSFEPQSITATLRSGCVVYKAVMQYCTLSPVDFWSPTVILMLSSCIINIFTNGF